MRFLELGAVEGLLEVDIEVSLARAIVPHGTAAFSDSHIEMHSVVVVALEIHEVSARTSTAATPAAECHSMGSACIGIGESGRVELEGEPGVDIV